MERRKFEDSFKEAFEGAEMELSDNVWAGIERELEKSDGSFKQAFYGAELNPSDNVWTGIELELEKAEGEKTRRRLLFYKLLAAASVTFAMCVAGIGFYIVNTKTAALNQQIASATNTQHSENNPSIANNDTASTSSDTQPAVTSEEKVTDERDKNDNTLSDVPATKDQRVRKQRSPFVVDNRRVALTPEVA